MRYPKNRIDIHERISELSFRRMMKYSDNRMYCSIVAKHIADEVVTLVHNNYRRRVK